MDLEANAIIQVRDDHRLAQSAALTDVVGKTQMWTCFEIKCLLTIRYSTRQKEKVKPFIIKGKSIGGPGLYKTDKIRSLF